MKLKFAFYKGDSALVWSGKEHAGRTNPWGMGRRQASRKQVRSSLTRRLKLLVAASLWRKPGNAKEGCSPRSHVNVLAGSSYWRVRPVACDGFA